MNQQQLIAKRKIETFNMLPNLIWSIVFLFPLVVFCYSKMPAKWFFVLLSISLPAAFLPNFFFNRLQVSKGDLFYKKAGVNFIGKFTQNGKILNRFIKKRFPEYKRFAGKGDVYKKLINQTYMFEKFHFILFVFFFATMLFAINNGFYIWASFLLIANVFYNVYPILLQQFIRIRLRRINGSKRTNFNDFYLPENST